LAAVLVLGVLLTSPGVPFFSDEGAPIIQARLLERTGSWIEPNPFPTIDPQQAARTVPNASVGVKGRAPYAEHPLYPLLIELVDRMAGSAGILALGVLGALGAALGAGLLAGEFDPRLAVPTLWFTGLGTPLLFDTGIVVAHTLGAAAASGAAWVTYRWLSRSPRRWHWPVLLFVASVVLAGLRGEGTILLVALAAGAAVAALGRRAIAAAAVAAAATLGAALIVKLGERVLLHRHVGAAVATLSGNEPLAPASFVHARIKAFFLTWWTPGYHPTAASRVTLLAAVVAVGVGALAARRARRPDLAAFLLVVATVAVILRLALSIPLPVPGLMLTLPAGWFALLAADRSLLASSLGRLLAVAMVLFGLGVLGTQYANGGGVEWGGRYFAIGLPLAVPLVVLVIDRCRRAMPRTTGQVVVGCFGAMSIALAVLSWTTLEHGHVVTRRVLGALDAQTRTVRAEGRPVVLTAERFIPQIDWPHYFDYRWLAPHRADVGTFASRLAADDVREVVLVTADPASDLPAVRPWYVVTHSQVVPAGSPVTIAVLTRT
jgi:hypothetical protein